MPPQKSIATPRRAIELVREVSREASGHPGLLAIAQELWADLRWAQGIAVRTRSDVPFENVAVRARDALRGVQR